MEILLLSEQEVADLLEMDEVLEVVELAFRESALGYAQMPPKSYLHYRQHNGDLRTMPAYLERLDISAVKIVNVHPNNMQEHGLPTVMATIHLVEPKTGKPLAIMGGRNITAMRTGAAGGIAAKYLAKKDSKVASFIGGGVQARTQLAALLSVMPGLSEIRVWDVWLDASEAFAGEIRAMNPRLQVKVAVSVESAVEGADIVVTTTPSTKPLIQNEWVSLGTHFNCIGADAPGKEEIDPAILRRSKIVVDNWEQASHSGEINIPVSAGMITKDSVWAELGEVAAGVKPGRTSPNEITVFDATGLAIQDAVTAELVLRKAIAKKKGVKITV
ncbi:MAG TPA: alanine dehydrogenase [Candidatus Acidoferrales bacterium]|nr:alanine dehydrogenase [Candidatus Acidoferrales bacterium]